MPRSRRIAQLVAALLAVVTVATGCASTGRRPSANSVVTSVSVPDRSRPTRGRSVPTSYGRQAASLAAAVPGCAAHPVSVSEPIRGLPVRTLFRLADSAATCSLRGRSAELLTFAGPTAQAATEARLRRDVAYYARGTGWVAVPVDLSEPVGQQSVVQDFALALSGQIVIGAAPAN